MPQYNLQNLRPFKKGVSGNPGGSRKLPPEIREAQKKNLATLVKLASEYLAITPDEAKARVERPDVTLLEQVFYSYLRRAQTGNIRAFYFVLNLACGALKPATIEPESKFAKFLEAQGAK